MKSLDAIKHSLSSAKNQVQLLEGLEIIPSFGETLINSDLPPLRTLQLEVLQINMGKMCNQVCKHCHVDAGPDRKEMISRDLLERCIDVVKKTDVVTVDLTGGAPEMHPDFRWFVKELHGLNVHIIVRCNLTIILANKKYYDLPEFFKEHQVEVVSSLPSPSALRTDAQRGKGVFHKSIEALQLLNKVGYGTKESGLELNLVYNPSGAFLPGNQESLEIEFKERLRKKYSIEFNKLFALTNVPISRFLDYLETSGNLEAYMEKLVDAYNPSAAEAVMCRNTLSVSWEGYLFDCDFNQMLDLKIENGVHLEELDMEKLNNRIIRVNKHCFACTAGAGSSCGGQTA